MSSDISIKEEDNCDTSKIIQSRDSSPITATMEAEKRIRREIANSNERRRMQSINAGFQSLRSLLPHHEGEKLSKAAILQQTAEYIYALEQEKTRLLSQNCQLKRLVNQQQQEVGELPPKKRKCDDDVNNVITMTPVVVETAAESAAVVSDLRRQLDRERGMRVVLEEQLRQLQNEIYQQQIYQATTGVAGVIDETTTEEIVQEEVVGIDDSVVDVDDDQMTLQVVAADTLPPVGHTQTVVCSPPATPSRTPTPEPTLSTTTVVEKRLPSVLEAAIKAEPKVEVERVPTAAPPVDEATTAVGRLYGPNTSRQNLETIVEAIRHLEGDHMFAEEPQLTQEAPLALTTTTTASGVAVVPTNTPSPDHILRLEMNHFIDFHVATSQKHHHQQHQQTRPGVIVVKQAS